MEGKTELMKWDTYILVITIMKLLFLSVYIGLYSLTSASLVLWLYQLSYTDTSMTI